MDQQTVSEASENLPEGLKPTTWTQADIKRALLGIAKDRPERAKTIKLMTENAAILKGVTAAANLFQIGLDLRTFLEAQAGAKPSGEAASDGAEASQKVGPEA